MFDLGFQELVVIFVVALLVFGPKRLPELARNLGKGIGQLRKAMMDMKAEVEKESEAGEAKEIQKADVPSWKYKAAPDIPEAGAPPSGEGSPGGGPGGAQPSEKKPGDAEKA